MADDKNVTDLKTENIKENKEEESVKNTKNDSEDLDTLLDSALDDFKESSKEEVLKKETTNEVNQDKRPFEHYDPNAFAQFFGGEQNADLQTQMQDAMNQILGPGNDS